MLTFCVPLRNSSITRLDVLPLARVIDDAKVTDHHAIIPTRADHPIDKMDSDDLRVYDMVVRRFLAAFHPEAVLENTRVETTVAEHVFRTRGKVLLVPGWRGVYLTTAEEELAEGAAEEDEGSDQALPRLEQGEPSRVLEVGIPVRMDNGRVEVFMGWRVHHDVSRGPGKVRSR